MFEKIIYSSKVNSSELLKTLSLNSTNVIGLRVLKLIDLLDLCNMKLGYKIKQNVLSNDEIEKISFNAFLNKVELVNPSYQDVLHFQATLNNIRLHILDSSEEKYLCDTLNNVDKNSVEQKLNPFFEEYKKLLGVNLDLISYMRKIIDCSLEQPIFDEIFYFKEDFISPLEKKLLATIARNVKEIKVVDLFGSRNEISKIKSALPRYGVRNEVAHIFKDIFVNEYPLDECEIILLENSKYVNEIYQYKINNKLDITFECGLPINLSNAYKLYSSLGLLQNKYFFDVNGYLYLFSSECLDLNKLKISFPAQVAQLLGRMKICFEKDKNELYLTKFKDLIDNHSKELDIFLEKIDRNIIFDNNKEEVIKETTNFINEISNGLVYFIERYTKINPLNIEFENQSLEFICFTIDYASTLPNQFKDSYLDKINNKYLSNSVFNDTGLHVCNISKGLSTIRKHIYILGMNSNFYPGNLTEDFLFSDDSYEKLCGINEFTETKLNEKNEFLHNVIDTYLALGKEVNLSYTSQELNEVRSLNPCSVFLDYIENIYSNDEFKNIIEKCSYYDDELSPLSNIAECAINNDLISQKELTINQSFDKMQYKQNMSMLDRAYSPSTIPSFLACPLRFYLDYIIGANNEIIYDPLRPMGGSRFGDLFHYVMEVFVKEKNNDSIEEIVAFANTIFDLYTSLDRSIGDDNLEKKNFLDCVKNSYSFLKQNFNLHNSKTELNIGYKSEYEKSIINGIHFHGSIDLVTTDKNDNLIIVDYKTGMHYEHDEKNLETAIQGLIYSQLYELNYGKKVSKLIFYYSRFNRAIIFNNPCDKESIELVKEKVQFFKESLINKQFSIADKNEQDDVCKYCKYSNICKKNESKEEDSDGE